MSYTALVIDDDKHVSNIITIVLTTKGFNIRVAMDGSEGLELIEEIKPDVVFLDFYMPGLKGWDVMQILQNNVELRDIPVIAITAEQIDDEDKLVEEHGFVSVIHKPFTPNDILENIALVFD